MLAMRHSSGSRRNPRRRERLGPQSARDKATPLAGRSGPNPGRPSHLLSHVSFRRSWTLRKSSTGLPTSRPTALPVGTGSGSPSSACGPGAEEQVRPRECLPRQPVRREGPGAGVGRWPNRRSPLTDAHTTTGTVGLWIQGQSPMDGPWTAQEDAPPTARPQAPKPALNPQGPQPRPRRTLMNVSRRHRLLATPSCAQPGRDHQGRREWVTSRPLPKQRRDHEPGSPIETSNGCFNERRRAAVPRLAPRAIAARGEECREVRATVRSDPVPWSR
jgi:hypothetical protein